MNGMTKWQLKADKQVDMSLSKCRANFSSKEVSIPSGHADKESKLTRTIPITIRLFNKPDTEKKVKEEMKPE